MKIGILGAPGSGKTKFAKKLAASTGKSVFVKPPKIIDGYVEKLIADTGFAFAYFATYAQNYQILFQRWTLEQIAQAKVPDTITCGTLYETIIYCGIKAIGDDSTEGYVQAKAAMTALGMIETTIFDYDVLLYLPYDGETLLEKGKSYDTVIDRKIPEVLAGYFKSAATLSGTEKENVRYATELIAKVKDEIEASEDDEQSIRGSGEDVGEKPS